MTGFGWLAADPTIARTPRGIAGIWLSPDLPTRWEEFTWVRVQVLLAQPDAHPLDVLDAGTGTDPGAHILPEILATDGHRVIAVDCDDRTLNLPSSPSILRIVDDMRKFTHLRHVGVDVYTTVSVVEHMHATERPAVWDEAFRVLRPGGTLIVTADDIPPQELANEIAAANFLVGGEEAFAGKHLNPKVAWVVARRPEE